MEGKNGTMYVKVERWKKLARIVVRENGNGWWLVLYACKGLARGSTPICG